MYGIKNGLKIDWPFIIKSTMIKCQSNSDLPYAIFIFRLINNFNIDVTDENVKETSFHDHSIGLSFLNKLALMLDPVDSKYKHKDDMLLY